MLKKIKHNLVRSFAIASALSISPTQAIDLADATTPQEQARFCESVWTIAKWAAKEADSGGDEDATIRKYETAAQGELGPNAMHVMRTAIKGTYTRSSDENASRYAMRSQGYCMKSWH